MPMKTILVPLVGALCLAAVCAESQSAEPAPERLAAGAKIYTNTCASCHMVDGSGVSNMQPPLDADAVVAGDPNILIRVVLEGPAKVLPADRPVFSNTMPPFYQLSDQDIADVLTYIRQQYGGKASAIDPSQVAALRRTPREKSTCLAPRDVKLKDLTWNWFGQGSSVVEQGTHKPLVGSSTLPPGTPIPP
jgi:mono/diheme cytochrome c family protein